MADSLIHEMLYRGAAAVERLPTSRILVCGVGAIGSLLADNLSRQGVTNLTVLDRDRVEGHNTGTQLFTRSDVGKLKTRCVAERIYDATGVEIASLSCEFSVPNARRCLREIDLVIDCFDNSASRQVVQDATRKVQIPCLHAGLHTDYGEVIWDQDYRVPRDGAGGDVCEYPLARNIILLAVTVASETVMEYLMDGTRRSHSFTLRDFAIRELRF